MRYTAGGGTGAEATKQFLKFGRYASLLQREGRPPGYMGSTLGTKPPKNCSGWCGTRSINVRRQKPPVHSLSRRSVSTATPCALAGPSPAPLNADVPVSGVCGLLGRPRPARVAICCRRDVSLGTWSRPGANALHSENRGPPLGQPAGARHDMTYARGAIDRLAR